MSSSIGKMRHRMRFERRTPTAGDGRGNYQSSWIGQFDKDAAIVNLRGGETVLSSRLAGTQPVIVTVRYDPRLKVINQDWRMVHHDDNTIYNIRSLTYREKKDYVDIVCETGVAT